MSLKNWRWPPRPWEAPTPTAPNAIFSAIGAWVTIALGNLGLSLGAAIAIGGAVTNLAIGVALLGINMLVNRPPAMKTQQAQAVINQSAGARVRGYGYALLGGTRAFFDSKDGHLYQVVMMHSGEIDSIEHYRVGDMRVTLDGNGDVQENPLNWPDGSLVRIRGHLGSANQVSDSLMLADWPGVWTSAHRLRGITNFVVRMKSPQAQDMGLVYPEGYNTPVRALCRLSRIWDPRNNTTAWSDNAGLCILDYLTHPDGFK